MLWSHGKLVEEVFPPPSLGLWTAEDLRGRYSLKAFLSSAAKAALSDDKNVCIRIWNYKKPQEAQAVDGAMSRLSKSFHIDEAYNVDSSRYHQAVIGASRTIDGRINELCIIAFLDQKYLILNRDQICGSARKENRDNQEERNTFPPKIRFNETKNASPHRDKSNSSRYFYSSRRLSYLRISPLAATVMSGILGPLYFAYLGSVEFSALYLMGIAILPNLKAMALWHMGFSIFAYPLLRGGFAMRGFHITSRGEVKGRFRKIQTLWAS